MFGLDSFHFQGKLLSIEYEDMLRMYNAITNRMYCEFYKLYKLILNYIHNDLKNNTILETMNLLTFPKYLDLEPFKKYDFTIIQNIHETSIDILFSLESYLSQQETDLETYKEKNKSGISIDNFINTFNYNNVLLKEQIKLFVNYIVFFHKMHNKYLSRFLMKAKLMHSQITHDIKLENENSKNRKERNH